jgi:F-type H+-transporting ATPase subunit a
MTGMNKPVVILLLALFTLMPCTQLTGLNSEEHSPSSGNTAGEKKFDPGRFILEHVMDSYEWHILTVGKTHISIPLPVILYTREKGLVVFMSSRFHHGHEAWKGFRIAEEGKQEGKIVQVKPNGNIDEEAPLPVDLSITKTVAAMLASIILILVIFLPVARKYLKNKNMAPTGLQNLLEPVILFVRDDIAKPSLGVHRYEKFMPYLLTVFFFILINNLLGIIPFPPGGANVTGNIAITGILALATLITIVFTGDKHYWMHLVNAPGIPWWLKLPVPLMPFIEILGFFLKPLVLCIRLFANMLAGHFIALSFIVLIFIFGQLSWIAGYGSSLVSMVFFVFMTLLELLICFIQAYVFTFLSALYIGMARNGSH